MKQPLVRFRHTVDRRDVFAGGGEVYEHSESRQVWLGRSQKNGKLEVAPRHVIALRLLLGFAQRAEQVPECLAGCRLANEDPARLAVLRPPAVARRLEVLSLVRPQYLADPLADVGSVGESTQGLSRGAGREFLGPI